MVLILFAVLLVGLSSIVQSYNYHLGAVPHGPDKLNSTLADSPLMDDNATLHVPVQLPESLAASVVLLPGDPVPLVTGAANTWATSASSVPSVAAI